MIKYYEEDNVAVIILNRPEKRNALNRDMVIALKERLDEIESNNSIGSLIFSGEGKSFCSGVDLEYLNELLNFSTVENEKDSTELAELYLKIYKFPKPTIAAVNGAAIAGGCGLASVCDFIFADSTNAKFGYSEIKIGFVPAIVSIFLIKRLGEGNAKQMLLSGEIIDGKRACEIGLVNYLSNDTLNDSLEFAKKLKENSAYSFYLTKKMLSTISNLSVDDAVKYCINLNTISRNSEDFKNGLFNFIIT
jgi:methylglutaconyl-CoA hydratase